MIKGKYALYALPVVIALLGISVLASTFGSNQQQATSSEHQILPLINDGSKVTGWVTLTVYDQFGNVKQKVENHNLVVDQGLDEMSHRVFGVGGVGTTVFNYIGIGTSSTAPSAGQTALVTPICTRVQDASPDSDSSVSGETSTSVISSFSGVTCAGAITEAGIFNAVSSGQMLARSTFGVVTIGASDTLNVNYTITIT